MAENPDKEKSGEIGSVRQAFNIIECLEETDGATVSEVSEKLDLPLSTAHVYLKTLLNAGYVTKEKDTYSLSLRFLKHGGYTRHQLDVYQVAKPEVDALSRDTGEVADFGMEENGQRVLLYKSEGPEGITQKPVTGEYTHMHMTALGKSLLSGCPDDRISEIIDTHGLPQATQYTITDREALFEEIQRIRDQGYAIEDQERREGIRAIGMPIEGADGHAIGSISISGPVSKITEERIENELRERMEDAVNIIEIRHKNY